MLRNFAVRLSNYARNSTKSLYIITPRFTYSSCRHFELHQAAWEKEDLNIRQWKPKKKRISSDTRLQKIAHIIMNTVVKSGTIKLPYSILLRHNAFTKRKIRKTVNSLYRGSTWWAFQSASEISMVHLEAYQATVDIHLSQVTRVKR
jgi:hypothetical protein